MKAAILLLAILLASCTAQTTEPIRIGMFGAFSGNLAEIGQQEIVAAEYAVEQVNAEGGIEGRPLQLVIEDAKCNPRDAVTAFNRLRASTDAAIILGGLCTGETLGAAPLANEQRIVLLSAVSSGPQVTNAGEYVFRTNPSDDGSFFASYIIGKGYGRVAIISEQTDFAIGVKDALLSKLDEAGVAYFMEDVPAEAADYRTALVKLQQHEPDILIMNSNSYNTGRIIYQNAAALGYETVMGSRGFEVATQDQLDEIEGLIFYGSFGIVNESLPEVREIALRYEERHGTRLASLFTPASQYDDVMLAANAMRACGATDGECMKEWLHGIEGREGLIGTFGFDENGDVTGIEYNAVQVQDGEIVVVT